MAELRFSVAFGELLDGADDLRAYVDECPQVPEPSRPDADTDPATAGEDHSEPTPRDTLQDAFASQRDAFYSAYEQATGAVRATGDRLEWTVRQYAAAEQFALDQVTRLGRSSNEVTEP